MFVNATLDEVAATADRVRLTLLQLHGDEGPAYCAEAARRTGCKVMKAMRVKDAAQVRGLRVFHTDYHLLDAYAPRTPGGTGETFNWELARLHEGPAEVVLSGGLDPDNVGEAIAVARRSRSARRAAPRRRRAARTRRACARSSGSRGGARAGMSSPPIERRFGPYGGRYVPETLIPALDELERAWLDARADPGRRGALLAAARLRGPSDAAPSGPAPVRGRGLGGVAQAGGPAPHGRAQDQQRPRPGAAGAADGQGA